LNLAGDVEAFGLVALAADILSPGFAIVAGVEAFGFVELLVVDVDLVELLGFVVFAFDLVEAFVEVLVDELLDDLVEVLVDGAGAKAFGFCAFADAWPR